MKRYLWALALPLALGACDTIKGTYNSWFGASVPAAKPAELVQIRPTVTPRIAWQSTIGAADKTVFFPSINGNTVWVGGSNGQIAAVAANSGAIITRFDAGQRIASGVAAGGAIVAVGTPRGELLAFHNSGKALWKAQLPGEILAPPAIEGDLVVARSGDGTIYGFDAASGKRRWVYQRASPTLSVRSHAGVVISRGLVIAGFPGGRLVAVSATNGGAAWDGIVALPKGATELERVADVTSAPVVDEARACAVAYQGRVVCFDAVRGTAIWGRDVSSFSGMAIDNRNLYITDEKNTVVALDKSNGSSVWKQDKMFGRGVSRPLALGRYVIVGDYQGYVHLLSREDGSFAGRIATDGSQIAAVPVPLDISTFLVQTRNGGVFAITVQ
ncbi:MAG: outer membrane protein assembly factor BamB [Burkholderiales bacterium]